MKAEETNSMTIKILVPATLRSYCHEAGAELIISAATVRSALEQIERSHPDLYKSICDETGAVRRHVHLFVNDHFIHDREGLDTALAPGDVLSIMPAVSGG
ncbi:MAG: MoaD family protein [Planctomycetia bacterium]|nr:MoaD family protein [Planctomycetia bacterium]